MILLGSSSKFLHIVSQRLDLKNFGKANVILIGNSVVYFKASIFIKREFNNIYCKLEQTYVDLYGELFTLLFELKKQQHDFTLYARYEQTYIQG